MRCPYCLSENTKVVDKRDSENFTKRRRECLKCKKRFTTHERVESVDMIVVKKAGERERYDRDKIKRGLIRACEKRQITLEQIDDTLDKIETELRKSNSTEIPSSKVGNVVIKYLKRLDKVAYIRFASVYKDFKDVEEFQEELKTLLKR
ncbi:transcriptional repressor NrdR [Candidatus Woesearchaeota archaeon]|jgi:transcriptional repressor NrdR|nr:transcriptional repressor NrdR [Candidatus Woesearchaeota archaeon]MBT7928712.1 transcriptional repressor NrdR [Candidatus Peregrinibacteria bacterium]MBT4368097.1 transcriptional repressor NrdR [Candidatus Woesearchaeota archaeon]MBT4712585.1 transcriptional repressor NrdR [Candidatus Woesearchaeota archaeon]MBT6639498.1 transcriptional repressor NrdR [Candidatus Woesearchaeota archaeon]